MGCTERTNTFSSDWRDSSAPDAESSCKSSGYESFRSARNNAAWAFNNVPGAAVAEPYTWDTNGITPQKHYSVNTTNAFADVEAYSATGAAGARVVSPNADYQFSYGGVTYNLYPSGTSVNIQIDLEGKGTAGYEREALGGFNFLKRNGYSIDKTYFTYDYTSNPSQDVERVETGAVLSSVVDNVNVNSSTNRYFRTQTLTITSPARPTTVSYTTQCIDEYELFVGDMKAYQLLELTDEGKSLLSVSSPYLTYNPNEGGELYFVNDDATAAKLTESQLSAAWQMINDSNAASCYRWTLKTWLMVEIPESYRSYAKNTDPSTLANVTTTMFGLNANGESISVLPNGDNEFAYIHQSASLGESRFVLSMNYNAENISSDRLYVNSPKEVAVNLVAPKAVMSASGNVAFEVVANAGSANGEVSVVDDSNNEYLVENATYNAMSASFRFVQPNVDSSIANLYDVVYLPVVDSNSIGKYVDADLASAEIKEIKLNNINLLADDISFELETRYYLKGSNYGDDEAYVVPTRGAGVNIVAKLPELEYASLENTPSVAVVIKVDQNADGTYNIYANETSVTFEQNPLIVGTELDNIYYDFDIMDSATDEISGLQLDTEIYDFGKLAEVAEVITPLRVSSTPVYVFIAGMTVEEVSGVIMHETASSSSAQYVALRGLMGYKDVQGGEIVGVESVMMNDVKIVAGLGYIEVIGAADNQLYDISGAYLGSGKSRYDVEQGIYLVKVGGKTAKVVVK